MRRVHSGLGALALVILCVDTAHGQCQGGNVAVIGFRRIGDSEPVRGVTATLSAVNNPTGACAVGSDAVVDITFRNIVGSDVAKLSAVWFDDECSVPPGMALMTLCDIIGDNSNGHVVHFSQGSTPHDPPNGNLLCPRFRTTNGFSADSDPNQINAVDEGEYVTLRFVLHEGRSLNDVITCLNQANPNADPCVPGLRISFNLDSPGGGSSSFNEPTAFVGGDCDCDGVPDECEISCSAANGFCSVFPDCGTASDCNHDNIPDSCQPCASPPVAPTAASSDPPTLCSGNGRATITLTATGGSGDILRWFAGSCGGTPIGTGSPLTIPAPSSTTNYFARWESNSCICAPSTCAHVTVQVNTSPPTPTNVTATPATICQGQSATLSATVPTVPAEIVVDWFTGSCGGTPVPGGSSPVVSPSSTTTYYARARITSTGCSSTNCASVSVTVNTTPAVPESPIATPSTLCAGQSATLSATVPSGVTVDWFIGSCGGTSVPGGASPVVSPNSTTTYFARARNLTGNCISTTCASVTIMVNPAVAAPTSPTATPAMICQGESSTLSATVPAGFTVDWFTGGCAGTPVPGGSSPVVSPSLTTTYFAQARNTSTGCISATCASVAVSVNATPPTPVNPTATPAILCTGQCSTLSATVPAGITLEWFSDSCAGMPVSGGASPLVCPTTTTTYFARARNAISNCASTDCASVMVTVNEAPVVPTDPTATPNPICVGDSSTLSATVPTGVTVEWFADSCDGAPVTGGASPVVTPSVTTTYYARARSAAGDCISTSCASVTLTVNPRPISPISASANPPHVCLPGGPLCTTLTAVLNPPPPNGRPRLRPAPVTLPVGGNVVVEWFAGGCGNGDIIGTGISIQVCPTIMTTYFARTRETVVDCSSALCADTTVMIEASPTPPTVSASVEGICAGALSTITLTAQGGTGTSLHWFDDVCGGHEIGTTTLLVIPAPLQTTTYYARMEKEDCTPSECATVTVRVDPLPDPPTVTAPSVEICAGDCTTLMATPGNGGDSLDWFQNACDGEGGTPIEGQSPQVCPDVGTTHYFVRTRNSTTQCVSATCASIDVIVQPRPNAPVNASAVPPIVCQGACSTLMAFFEGRRRGSLTVDWFVAGCGVGEPVDSGISLEVCPTVETTYFARARDNLTGCTSTSCAMVTLGVTVPPVPPTSITSTPDGFCEGYMGNLTLAANGGAGETLHWFLGACGEGPDLGTGNPIIVPAPSVTTTYCARWEKADCPPSTCVCLTFTPFTCEDNNLCTFDACDQQSAVCVHTPISNCCTQPADCDDQNPCTTDECTDNQCVHTPIAACCSQPADCEDNDPCTTDTCSDNLCVHTPIANCCTQPADCDDQNICTTDTCADNQCVHTHIANCCQTAADCDDSDPCTVDSCSDNLCVHTVPDDDQDGVPNCRDNCPGTPVGQPVDSNGCACSQRDTDQDGVNDCDDLCPNTPAGEPVNAVGCSCSQLDDDGDGVNNCNDQCPDTPSGTEVDATGCPTQTPGPTTLPCDPDSVRVNIVLSITWLSPVCGPGGCPIYLVGALCGIVTLRSRLRSRRSKR